MKQFCSASACLVQPAHLIGSLRARIVSKHTFIIVQRTSAFASGIPVNTVTQLPLLRQERIRMSLSSTSFRILVLLLLIVWEVRATGIDVPPGCRGCDCRCHLTKGEQLDLDYQEYRMTSDLITITTMCFLAVAIMRVPIYWLVDGINVTRERWTCAERDSTLERPTVTNQGKARQRGKNIAKNGARGMRFKFVQAGFRRSQRRNRYTIPHPATAA